MGKFIEILRIVAVLAAAGLLGNWFLTEVRKSRAKDEPLYKPYLTVPGVLVVIALMAPVIYWLVIKMKG